LPQIQDAASISMLVGPEGGFTTAEVQHAQDAGFCPISLGPLVLRSETAALTLVALVAFASGRLDHDAASGSAIS
ncbi:MAG: RNA methyltransferase, partial [Deltaproteobacteria bacterium]|nr:RNA methyltransferase [Deltaproteobacteria bacterium]